MTIFFLSLQSLYLLILLPTYRLNTELLKEEPLLCFRFEENLSKHNPSAYDKIHAYPLPIFPGLGCRLLLYSTTRHTPDGAGLHHQGSTPFTSHQAHWGLAVA